MEEYLKSSKKKGTPAVVPAPSGLSRRTRVKGILLCSPAKSAKGALGNPKPAETEPKSWPEESKAVNEKKLPD
jgi:hypothetical protein